MSVFFSGRYAQLEPYTPGEQPQDRRYIRSWWETGRTSC